MLATAPAAGALVITASIFHSLPTHGVRACDTLRLLTDKLRGPMDPGCGRWLLGGQVMAAAGIAFAFVNKGGLGVACMRGHGFVIHKVCNPLAPARLSTKRAVLMSTLQCPLARHA